MVILTKIIPTPAVSVYYLDIFAITAFITKTV